MNIENSQINSLIIHKIGIKTAEENDSRHNNFYSSHEIQAINLDEQTQYQLSSYFFRPILKSRDLFQFKNTDSEVCSEITKLFNGETSLLESSKSLAQILYDKMPEEDETYSDFFVVRFSNILFQDVEGEFAIDALGLFKSEKKDVILKLMQNDNEINFQIESGINLGSTIEKAVLIFNIDAENGYKMYATDKQKSGELYWIDSFLESKIIETEYFNTETFMKTCQEFDKEILSTQEKITGEDRARFLQQSLNYFQRNETFNEEQFTKEILQNDNAIEAFKDFRTRCCNKYEIQPTETFDIDQEAVKKSKRYLRSVIKLDKNFHIYVHSNTENIEQGVDDAKNKRFYKLFYDIES